MQNYALSFIRTLPQQIFFSHKKLFVLENKFKQSNKLFVYFAWIAFILFVYLNRSLWSQKRSELEIRDVEWARSKGLQLA